MNRAAALRTGTVLVGVLTLTALPDFPSGTRPAAAAEAAGTIPLIHCSDTAEWNSSRWGREQIVKAAAVKDALLLSSGGSLAASGRPAVGGRRFPVRMLEAAGFDAVNLAHRDLAASSDDDATDLLGAMAAARRTTFLSANVTLASGQAPWKPYLLIERGGQSLAVVGVTSPSRALMLPGAGTMKGVDVGDPGKALEDVLTQLKGKAARIVLLADAPPAEVGLWLERFKQIDLALVPARHGAPVRTPGSPRLLGSPSGGRSLSLAAPAQGGAVRATEILLLDPKELSPEYRKVAGEFRLSEKPVTLGKPRAAREASGRPLTGIEPERTIPVSLRAANRAVAIEATSVLATRRFGDRQAADGRLLLVVNTRWENILEPQVVREKELPVAYLMKKMEDHLYLVADGGVIVPAAGLLWPNQLGRGEFLLPGPGSTITGRLIYEIPAEALSGIGQLQLRLYDFAHGNTELTLVRSAEFEKLAAPKPVTAPVRNELVELAVFGMERAAELAGRRAPAGCEFLTLDIRARSCLTFEGDATAYDPKAKPGDKLVIGTVCDWKDWPRYLGLVVDGEYAVAAERGLPGLPDEPRFLPDLLTGARTVFAVPQEAKSIQLRFSYPHAATPDRGEITPTPLSIQLLGKPPALPAPGAAQTIEDEGLKVSISGGRPAAEYNGLAAGAGSRWYACNVTVANKGEKGEFLQTDKQFEFVKADGSKLAMDGRVFGAAYGPSPLILVPPGERRSFRAAWLVPESENRPRVAYNGYSLAKIIAMPNLDGQPAATIAQTTPPPSPPPPPAGGNEEEGKGEPAAGTGDPPGPDTAELPAGDVPVTQGKPQRPGPQIPVGRAGANLAVSLTVKSMQVTDACAGNKANKGWLFLVVDATWKRTIGEKDFEALGLHVEEPRITPASQLFCVVNGDRLLPAAGVSGRGVLRSDEEFRLTEPDAARAGVLAWLIPDSLEVRSACLKFYDPVLGGFTVAMTGEAAPVPDKLAQTGRNEIMELGLYRFRTGDRSGSHRAPKGMQYVTVDVGLRSLMIADAKGPRIGGTETTPAVLRWQEPFQYCQLLIDGGWVLPAERDLCSFKQNGPFCLPDTVTRQELVFLAPAQVQSIELECGGRQTVIPGQGPVMPAAIRLPIQGEAPAAADFKPFVALDDDGLALMVSEPTLADKLGNHEAQRGRTWLAIDVALENRGKTPEVLDLRDRLTYLGPEDTLVEFSSASYALSGKGLRQGPDWIPAGGRRRCRLAWQIPEEDKTPRLSYTGAVEQKLLDLTGGRAHALQTGNELHLGKTRVFNPELKPKGLEGVGLKPEDVNRAIDRGRDYLWKHLWQERTDKGRRTLDSAEDVLVCTALVHAEAHKKLPEFDAQLKRFLREVQISDFQTYEVGLLATLIEQYGDPAFEPLLRQATRFMIETQGKDGTFGYHAADREAVAALLRAEAPVRPAGRKRDTPAARPVVEVQGGTPIDAAAETRPAGETWSRRSAWEVGADGDNSITQFAMLGLWAANRSRQTIDRNIWKQVLARTRSWQCDDHGWDYSGRSSRGYGSMTCAGICTLAICLEHLGRKPLDDLGVQQGLRWLIENKWNYDANTKHDKAHLYYYIYSIERVGRILDIEFIGDREWYPLGAQHLVGQQKKDGSWPEGDGESAVLRTSFALLFLTRATPSFKPKPKPQEGDGTLLAGVKVPSGARYYLILDASGSMLSKLGEKTKFDIARNAVLELMDRLPAGSEVALRVYGNRERAVDMEGRLNEKANTDSTLEIAMGRLDKTALAAKLKSLRAVGKTPLAHSLTQAAEDMGNLDASQENPVHVVLLTDGGEDTQPRGDPVKAAGRLAGTAGVKLNIVGFDIGRKDWQEQLQAMSKAAGTEYWPATQPGLLSAQLQNAALQAPAAYRVLDVKGAPVATGQFGTPIQLRQGQYAFEAEWRGRSVRQEFWINTGSTTALTLDIGELEKQNREGR